jgi:hypothetical protein
LRRSGRAGESAEHLHPLHVTKLLDS